MDGTENQKDTSGATQDTSTGTKGTSGGEPETLTREQAQKQTSDALSAAGRDAKSLVAREEAIKAEQAKITQWQKERDDAELESLGDDPEGRKLFQKRQALRDKEKQLGDDRATLEKEKLEHKAKIEAAEGTEREIVIWEVAQKQGVDASKLKELSTELNLQTKEQIERVAKEMGAGKAKPTIKPDSGVTTGGDKDLSGMSSRQAFRSHLEDKK